MQDDKTLDRKKIIYSAIQPTGAMTLGNYLGAVNNWVPMQEDNDCIFAIANLHSLTVRQVPAQLRAQSTSFFAQLLACGIDPKRSILYYQSTVPQHTQLSWILNCYTYVGEMERMTQYKDKSAKNADNINMGLLDYPVLMAADILLYGADMVPVGQDQKQHLEIARDIAVRFNNIYGDVFTVPEPYIGKSGARIMSLAEPVKKMSKSDPNENATIFITDAPEAIVRKIKRAVTDCDNSIVYDENRPGISNLMNIYSVVTGATLEEITSMYDGKGYGVFKQALADAIVEKLRPVQAEYARLIKDKEYLCQVAVNGQNAAFARANRILRKVYKKVGLVQL